MVKYDDSAILIMKVLLTLLLLNAIRIKMKFKNENEIKQSSFSQSL